jgi:hypothetical protein
MMSSRWLVLWATEKMEPDYVHYQHFKLDDHIKIIHKEEKDLFPYNKSLDKFKPKQFSNSSDMLESRDQTLTAHKWINFSLHDPVQTNSGTYHAFYLPDTGGRKLKYETDH